MGYLNREKIVDGNLGMYKNSPPIHMFW